MKNIIKKIKKNELKTILKNIKHFNQFFDYLKIKKNSKNTQLLRSKIIAYNLEKEASHIQWQIRSKPAKEDSLDKHCAECNFTGLWNNQPLTLKEFQQKMPGNRLEKIYKCPNCISQMNLKSIKITSKINQNKDIKTDQTSTKPINSKKCTKCFKLMIKNAKTGLCKECLNIEKTNKNLKEISKEDLEKLFWEMPSTQIAELFDLSDTYLSRYAKKLGIQKPSRGYWTGRR